MNAPLTFTEAEPGGHTTFGAALWSEITESGAVARWRTTHDRLEEFMRFVARDSALMERSGRWQPGRPDPVEYVPGDVCATRAIVGGALLQEWLASERAAGSLERGTDAHHSTLRRLFMSTICVGALYDAVPFFLEADMVDGLLRSDVPPAETRSALRLPFPTVLVHFGREFALPGELVLPSGTSEDISRRAAGRRPGWASYQYEIDEALVLRGGSVTGVVLFAGPDGVGLDDRLIWLVSAEPDPTQPAPANLDRQRGALVGSLGSCLLRDAVFNLACATAWLDWEPPDNEPIPDPGDKAWRKVTRSSRFKRHEQRGTFAAVHVVARPDRVARHGRSETNGPKRASPVPHLRQGHWRSVRVVERDEHGAVVGRRDGVEGTDWHYEGRWIAPSVVNPSGRPDGRPRVYRLPSRSYERDTSAADMVVAPQLETEDLDASTQSHP